MNVGPYEVRLPEDVLKDLHARIRWPDEVKDAGWDYGAPLAYTKELVEYWREGFDWRKQEQRINSFHSFRAEVDGIGIHFVYERGKGPDLLPLIITHGWPSSFYEMLELIPLLTDPGGHDADPADSFDAVVPSVPGHGFSARPTKRGFEDRPVAELWVKQMEGLGYERFAAHAYDLGASVMGLLCLDHPERVIGYHTTSPANPAPYLGPGTPELTDAERTFLEYLERWYQEEGGYAHILGTRPQTLVYGLNDSPAGLCA